MPERPTTIEAARFERDRVAEPEQARPVQPRPPSRIAAAARAFGDAYPDVGSPWPLRATGVLVLAMAAVYLPWMFGSLNDSAPWLAYPFAAANVFSILYILLSIANLWSRRVPPRRPLPAGAEPHVGVIVPTCGEPVPMILRTVASVLEQDWPYDRLTVIVSDDGHDPELERAVADLPVVYHSPPPRFSSPRNGAAKAGNLNSALELLDAEFPQVTYVETRDADDELGSDAFLRQVVGQLEHDEKLAFVQTIKEAQVAAGDPFNNRESTLYRGQMLARNAANAVFPCGSGVVWRRTALRDIGEFPVWNLVEDLQSGVEALRRGWRSMYLPIVGAVGQHSPEDVPNVYKQRGTWAIDTVRLMVWGDLRGLNLRQRAQFMEMLVFYLNGFTVLVYVPAVVVALLGVPPIESDGVGFLTHLLPYSLAVEAWLLTLAHPYNDRRRRQRRLIRALWRIRIIWTGMAPIFIKATVQALLGGPKRKPVYKVTRKTDDPRFHWRQTLPQTTLVAMVVAALVVALATGSTPDAGLLVGALYWGGIQVALLAGFAARSRHGVVEERERRSATATERRREAV